MVALALLGRWRAALAGVGTVAAGALLLALAVPACPPGTAGPGPGRRREGAGGHARGCGTRPWGRSTPASSWDRRRWPAAGPPPISLPAFALTLGALLVGTWLAGRAVWSARGAGPSREAVAVCLAMVAGLLLAGTTPRAQLMPAMLVLLPLGGRLTWAVAGYVFAATSVPALATAAAPCSPPGPPWRLRRCWGWPC